MKDNQVPQLTDAERWANALEAAYYPLMQAARRIENADAHFVLSGLADTAIAMAHELRK